MHKNQVRPETYAYPRDVLEGNVVVEILAPTGGCTPRGLLGIGRRSAAATGPATTTRPAAGRALRPGARGSAAARPAPPPEHLQLVADDLGRVALVPLLVLPLTRAQASLDVHLRALAQVLAVDFCQAPEERDAVPFGPLLLLTGLLVAPALAGGDAQVGHGRAGGHGAGLGIGSQVANENHFVDATRHEKALGNCDQGGEGRWQRPPCTCTHSRGAAQPARTANRYKTDVNRHKLRGSPASRNTVCADVDGAWHDPQPLRGGCCPRAEL